MWVRERNTHWSTRLPVSTAPENVVMCFIGWFTGAIRSVGHVHLPWVEITAQFLTSDSQRDMLINQVAWMLG